MGKIESEFHCFISLHFYAHNFCNALSYYWHPCCQKFEINRIFSCHI
jgi:hypothetical protein